MLIQFQDLGRSKTATNKSFQLQIVIVCLTETVCNQKAVSYGFLKVSNPISKIVRRVFDCLLGYEEFYA